MKKLFKRIVAVTILGGGGLYWFMNVKTYDAEYAIPEGFRGCAYVVFNVENAPPLKVKNNVILYKIDDDGVMLTSSSEDFGWEGKKFSGFHKTNYYYVNENGKKVSKIPEDKIYNPVLGYYQEEEKILVRRETFAINDTNANCDTDYDALFKILEKKLGKKIK